MKSKIKKLEIIIILLLLIILILVGYIVYGEYKKGALNLKENNDKIQQQDPIKIDSSKQYVYDANYKYESDYDLYTYPTRDISQWTNKLIKGPKSIVVPYININTNDAREVNIDLYHLFMDKMQKLEGLYKQKKGIPSINDKSGLFLNYVTFYTKKYLSVIVATCEYNNLNPKTTYYGYVFNLKTGKLLTLEDIAAVDKMSVDELEEKTKQSIEQFAIKQDAASKLPGLYTNKLNLTYERLHGSIKNQGKVDAYTDGVVYFIDDFQSIVALVNINVDNEEVVNTYSIDVN